MGDFAPSTAAARVSNGDTKIVTRKHPSGAQGAFLSLREVCHRILEGRLDPRIRAWSIQTLQKANRPKSHRDRAQALLDGLRSKAMYVPDPSQGEFIQAARLTLCLDDKGFCFAGGDCDDMVIAFGSCCMSVGIPVKVVGQAFDGTNTPTHVIAALETERGEWLRVDPSSEKWPVGQAAPATGESWLDPFDEDDKQTGLEGGATTGDYVGVGTHVGVGAAPQRFERHWYPVGVGGWRYEDHPAGLGQHPIPTCPEDPEYTRKMGLGQQHPGFIHSAVTNAATWIDYGAVGAAIGVVGYILFQITKK